jgi:hypothetical protein
VQTYNNKKKKERKKHKLFVLIDVSMPSDRNVIEKEAKKK